MQSIRAYENHKGKLVAGGSCNFFLQEPGTSWPILERWNVPWDGKVTAVGMAIWLFRYS
jgi:hypothetical protein